MPTGSQRTTSSLTSSPYYARRNLLAAFIRHTGASSTSIQWRLSDLPLTWKRKIEDLNFDHTITYVECGYDIFDSLSDAKMRLTARGFYIDPVA
ncbi:hypothetical protein DF057_25865 [Burkholderia cepacia]|uniref:hypothetical protein n=1 Tax=Burkholderia cepacia TaxID=292 RepID=UPI000F5DA2DB|nr:hypothetical protein [Burkholderia cepacia]RQZ58036.1 hypothetical protein DF057_25865 [Burkholderia cepacia]